MSERNTPDTGRPEIVTEEEILRSASVNLAHVAERLENNPVIQSHLRDTGKKISLARKRRIGVEWPGSASTHGISPIPALPILRTSELFIDARGIVIKDDADLTRLEETLATESSLKDFWRRGIARSLIKSWAHKTPTEIDMKLLRAHE